MNYVFSNKKDYFWFFTFDSILKKGKLNNNKILHTAILKN